NDYAMNNIGRFYKNGYGGPQDDRKAREWYEKAANAGNRYGKSNLAWLLQEGRGGPTDFPRAAKLLLDAAAGKEKEIIRDFAGGMGNYIEQTRTELKRELARLGHYAGPIDANSDDSARKATKHYLEAASLPLIYDGVWKGMWDGTAST